MNISMLKTMDIKSLDARYAHTIFSYINIMLTISMRMSMDAKLVNSTSKQRNVWVTLEKIHASIFLLMVKTSTDGDIVTNTR